ncbi:hypothetical protein G6F43_003230 [Rhizopus delemar]|nr:hypothetical protein G6F43_003230 [Rhizopus delemar]
MMNNNFNNYHPHLIQRDETMLLDNNNIWIQNTIDNDKNELVTNPVACDLKDIILYYQSQPDLLKLILSSKVEEDKRRIEEAKLKAKELDLLLQQHHHNINNHHFMLNNQFDERRPSVIDILLEDDCHRRDSALGSSFDGSSNSNDELDERTFSPTFNNNAASMLSMSFPPQQPIMANQKTAHVSPPFQFGQDQQEITSQIKLEHRSSSFSSSVGRRDSSHYLPPKPRRRREMQAISKIVETRENPYNDGFFWKNNGNTIQKKTGNKSIYYKCSNSTKGCPVNKTVTAKENGEYLIKYRGEHLPDCGKVQRIVDV